MVVPWVADPADRHTAGSSLTNPSESFADGRAQGQAAFTGNRPSASRTRLTG